MAMREVRPGVWKGEIWHQGRRRTITFHGSASGAKLYEAQKRIEIRQTGIIDQRSAPPFETFCVEQYKPYAKANLRKRTWDDVRRYQVEHLVLFFKDTKLTNVREPLIEKYKQERLKSVGKVTINSELSVLSAVLTFARDALKVPCANPKINYFKVRPKKGRVKFWTLEEVQRIYDTCMQVALFPLVLFLGQTGARKSEAIHLPWSRVDFDRRIVKIWSETDDDDEDADEDDPYEVKSVEREVPLSDAVFKELAELKLRRISTQWVFPVLKGKHKGEQYAYFPDGTFDRVVKAAGLKGGPHKLRHSYASNFLARKPDLYLLGRLLGHTHERVTALYAHLVPGYLEEARNVVPVTVPKRPTPTPPKPNPVHRPVHRAKSRASKLPQVAGINLVGARGFEPPTPTVSR